VKTGIPESRDDARAEKYFITVWSMDCSSWARETAITWHPPLIVTEAAADTAFSLLEGNSGVLNRKIPEID